MRNEFNNTHGNIFTTFYVCISSYAREHQTSSIRKSYLGTNIFQWRVNVFVRGNSYSKELFRHIKHNTSGVWHTTPFFVSTTNDVTTHHYFFQSHLFSSERCFCVFNCIVLCLQHFFPLSNVIQNAS